MSWRFGRSLGIDPVPPPKRCTFNCVYCQLGPTKIRLKAVGGIQRKLPDEAQVKRDLDEYLTQVEIESLDVATFSGSGEPTLNLHIGAMVRLVRTRLPNLPIVLLTNGSVISNPQVMENLSEFDIVTVKFDAGDDTTHQAINRPSISFRHAQLVKGIRELRKITKAMIALEVMLLRVSPSISNVNGRARNQLLNELVQIAPVADLIQLYTPWRPPAESNVQPIDKSELEKFAADLSEKIAPEKMWIYGVHDARKKGVSWKSHKSLQKQILTMLSRRPCRLKDLVQSLDLPINRIMSLVSQLRRTDKITARQHLNDIYYVANYA